MKTINLTLQEIKEKGLKHYFKVVLLDADAFEVVDIIGRFETLEEARNESRRYANEVLDGKDAILNIYKYRYDEMRNKYKMDVGAKYTF